MNFQLTLLCPSTLILTTTTCNLGRLGTMTSSALQPSPQVSPYYHPSGAMEFMSDIAEMDEAKPSLFELLSESQLRELLEPSLRYLLAIATQRHPRYLLRILNRYDEVYALLMLLIERHYLKRWGGSFTENFYGLKRVRVTAAQLPRAERFAPALVAESLKLKRADIWKSLFVIVCLSPFPMRCASADSIGGSAIFEAQA